MSTLPILLKVGAALVMAIGTRNLLLGITTLTSLTPASPFPIHTPAGRMADNQYRFLGGIEAGWGAMVWWASNDIATRKEPLAILGGIMALSVVGRAISGVQYGFPSSQIPVFMAAEAGVPLAFWLFGSWN